jgi:hypothetical protein
MWAQLCAAATDLRIELVSASADDSVGEARWEAWYTFGPAKRPVHNVIDVRFRFVDGKVVVHEDHFDFWRWSRQALGPVGLLLAWTGWLRRKVQAQARKGLDRYLESRKAG